MKVLKFKKGALKMIDTEKLSEELIKLNNRINEINDLLMDKNFENQINKADKFEIILYSKGNFLISRCVSNFNNFLKQLGYTKND